MRVDNIFQLTCLATFLFLFQASALDKPVEYIKGDLPVIITAPHGGRLQPEQLPDRTVGVTLSDANTDLLARAILDQFKKNSGKAPYTVICNIKRIKLDCNRPLKEACEEQSPAVEYWQQFHRSVRDAVKSINESGKKYLLIDLHGHGHEIQRLELGYLVSANDLRLEGNEFEKIEHKSSFKGLKLKTGSSFDELIRGESSLGTLFAKAGFDSVPSFKSKEPGKGNKYFSGGYITREYGAQKSRNFAVQLETFYKGVRDTKKNRENFAEAFVKVVNQFVEKNLK